jgi:hypothetical protein
VGAINGFDHLVQLQTSSSAETIFQHKDPRVAGAAAVNTIGGQTSSLWEYEGIPSHGAVPAASWVNPTNATPGGILHTDPAGILQKWLTSLYASASQAGMFILYDRLGQISGLSGLSTGAQNINGGSPALPTRYTNGLGNILFAEIYTQIGTVATTITAAYADDAGNASTTQPVTWGATNNREAQRAKQLSLAAGDKGVRSVTSVTAVASTTTAGNFGLVMAHPIAQIPVGASGAGVMTSFLDAAIQEIKPDACLAWLFVPISTGPPIIDQMFAFVEC